MSRIIKKESLPLDQQVRFLLSDIKRLSDVLIKLEKYMDNAKEEYERNLVMDDLADVIVKYSSVVQETRVKLEEYFAYEAKENLPVNLNFRKVYKELVKS